MIFFSILSTLFAVQHVTASPVTNTDQMQIVEEYKVDFPIPSIDFTRLDKLMDLSNAFDINGGLKNSMASFPKHKEYTSTSFALGPVSLCQYTHQFGGNKLHIYILRACEKLSVICRYEENGKVKNTFYMYENGKLVRRIPNISLNDEYDTSIDNSVIIPMLDSYSKKLYEDINKAEAHKKKLERKVIEEQKQKQLEEQKKQIEEKRSEIQKQIQNASPDELNKIMQLLQQ